MENDENMQYIVFINIESLRKRFSDNFLINLGKKLHISTKIGENYIETVIKFIISMAQRRKSPNLKNFRLDLQKRVSAYTNENGTRLTDEEYLYTLILSLDDSIQQDENSNDQNMKEKTQSQAYILLAQTGAGKSNLRKRIMNSHKGTIIIIDPDQYKKYRPDFETLMIDKDFGALTGIDSYDISRNITAIAMKIGLDLLVENAPGQDDFININIDEMKKNNYSINISAMAVGDVVSKLGVIYRYLNGLAEKNGSIKLTDQKRHDASYHGVGNVLEKYKNKANKIEIFRRGTEEEMQIPQLIVIGKNEMIGDALDKARDESSRLYLIKNENGESYYKMMIKKISDLINELLLNNEVSIEKLKIVIIPFQEVLEYILKDKTKFISQEDIIYTNDMLKNIKQLGNDLEGNR